MNNYKIIWLMGGFGNTLYQIFAARILENYGYRIVFSDTLTKKNIATVVGRWTIHNPIYKELIAEDSRCEFSVMYPFVVPLSKKTKRRIFNVSFCETIEEAADPKVKHIFGYFQKPGLIKENPQVFEQLTAEFNRKLINNTAMDRTVVHVRFGDSGWALKNQNHYKKVYAELKGTSFDVVTDDMSYAKSIFGLSKEVNYYSSKNPLDDFISIASAGKIYCAPSTFSWWAAHCSDINSKLVFPEYIEKKLGIFAKQESYLI